MRRLNQAAHPSKSASSKEPFGDGATGIGLAPRPQAPYPTKTEVDANFKRMVAYGCKKEHAQAAHLESAVTTSLTLPLPVAESEKRSEGDVCFEMLEGMADHMRRVVQQVSGDMLLYCPAAKKKEFQNAVAYLVRRLDEKHRPRKFSAPRLRLETEHPQWDHQVKLFSAACIAADRISIVFTKNTEPRGGKSQCTNRQMFCP